MRITVVRDDSVVGIDGVFRVVDLSATMPEGVRAMQWIETSGYAEHDDSTQPNTPIDSIDVFQPFIDLWEAAAPPAPTSEEMIADAKARIDSGYWTELSALSASFPVGEREARAYLIDNTVSTPWLKGLSEARRINIPNLVVSIIRSADEAAAQQGAAAGKRANLMDEIDALGPNPTQEQLDAIQW